MQYFLSQYALLRRRLGQGGTVSGGIPNGALVVGGVALVIGGLYITVGG